MRFLNQDVMQHAVSPIKELQNSRNTQSEREKYAQSIGNKILK